MNLFSLPDEPIWYAIISDRSSRLLTVIPQAICYFIVNLFSYLHIYNTSKHRRGADTVSFELQAQLLYFHCNPFIKSRTSFLCLFASDGKFEGQCMICSMKYLFDRNFLPARIFGSLKTLAKDSAWSVRWNICSIGISCQLQFSET